MSVNPRLESKCGWLMPALRLLMVSAVLVGCLDRTAWSMAAGGHAPSLPALASWYGAGTYYYLRAAPSMQAPVLGQVAQNTALLILSSVQGEAEDGNPWWYQVRIQRSTGYLSSNAVAVAGSTRHPWIAIATNNGDSTATEVEAYRGPHASDPLAAHFALGARFTVLGQVTGDAVEPESAVWYLVADGRLPAIYIYSPMLKFTGWGTTAPPRPLLSAVAAIAIDVRTGRMLFQLQASVHRRPASTAKIMTALVALRRRRPSARLMVPDGVASVTTDVGGSAMGVTPGQVFTLHDLLYGLLLPSGNDAAYTIAQDIAGSQAAFVSLMNATAARLGLHHTHFTNTTGLDDVGEYTTAADLARLARYVLSHEPLFAAIVRTRTYALPATAGHPAFSLQNLNQLLGTYPGAQGVKTGTTPQAGQNLVAAATRLRHQVLVVVLGSADRYTDGASLLDYAFATTR
ncbi:MAG TPA: SH3 domain-containing protein [Chloroflexota bacterium]|nr:SH3 domain-containing protein [Chloroflexota bacterium]